MIIRKRSKEYEATIKAMVDENTVRTERLKADYNPLTGEGAPGERVKIRIPDFQLPDMWVPRPMLETEFMRQILKYKTIDAFVAGYHPDGINFSRNDIEKELINQREKHDFLFWAYFEIHIDSKTGEGMIPFKLNYAQLTVFLKCEELRLSGKPINLVICKARQWGGSTFCLFYQVWIALKWNPSHKFSVCAQVNGVAQSITQMFSDALTQYNAWTLGVKGPLSLTSVPNSAEHVIRDGEHKKVRRNIIRIGSVENPDNLRGLPGSGVHFSEVAVWPDTPGKQSRDLVRAIAGGILPRPYTMQVFESTPKGEGNFFHQTYLDAKDGRSSFTAVFIPWFFIPHQTLPVPDKKEFASWLYDNKDNQNTDGKFLNSGQYYWRLWEMGATFEGIQWYRWQRLGLPDQASMASEAPSDDIEAFQNSGSAVFDVYHLDALRRDCKAPVKQGALSSAAASGAGVLRDIRFVEIPDGPLEIWREPDRSMEVSDRYLVTVDVGGRNRTSDWTVMRVFDRMAMMQGGLPEVVAQLRYHADYDLLSYDAMRLAHWYCDALLVIESNTLETKDQNRDTDGDMSEYILDIISGLYDNLYARAASAESIRQGKPRRWGFSTNWSTKPAIIGNLISCVREHLWIERDTRAIDEMAIYQKNDKGQFNAAPGKGNHDDILMATAIGLWICFREMETPSFKSSRGPITPKHAAPDNAGAF